MSPEDFKNLKEHWPNLSVSAVQALIGKTAEIGPIEGTITWVALEKFKLSVFVEVYSPTSGITSSWVNIDTVRNIR